MLMKQSRVPVPGSSSSNMPRMQPLESLAGAFDLPAASGTGSNPQRQASSNQRNSAILALDWRIRNSEVWPYKLNNTLRKLHGLSENPLWKAWIVFPWETKPLNPVLLRAQILDSHTKQVCQLPKSSESYLRLWIVRGEPWNLQWSKLMYRQNWGHWPSPNEHRQRVCNSPEPKRLHLSDQAENCHREMLTHLTLVYF